MSVAFFVKAGARNIEGPIPDTKEVLIASLDNLVGDYVIFAKCVIAMRMSGSTIEKVTSGPLAAFMVELRLVFGERSDSAWAYLPLDPKHLEPMATVALNIASTPPAGTPGASTIAPGFIPPAVLASGDAVITPSKSKGTSAQLFCTVPSAHIEVRDISMTAIKVDAINPA